MDVVWQHLELLQKLHTGIVVHAPDTHIIFSNYRASELLGLSADQLQGKVAIDPAWCFIKEDGAMMAPSEYPVSRVIANREPVTDLVLGIRKPDTTLLFWVLVSAFPEFDEVGALKYVVVNFYDISQRKSAEETLKQSETQLRFVLEGAELGFWDWNIVTGEVARNERWAAMLGYSFQEIQQTTQQWSDFVHPEDRERAWLSINAALDGRSTTHKLEYRMLHKDGGVRWILDQAKVMQRDAQGKPIRMCGTHADVTERKFLEEELKRQAQVDYLTGVCNRRHFMERAEMELARAVRYGKELSIFMMDIDFFKQLNDRYGHKVGDSVLKKLAVICQETLRSADILGRMGGEEFAVLLPETDSTVAAEVAARLREAIAFAKVPLEKGLPAQFTVSIGVTSMSSKDDNMDVLLNVADKALYEAKNTGRNRVCVATSAKPDLDG